MSLQTFLRILLRNWWMIALLVIVAAGSSAFFVSRQKPLYTASAMLELRPSDALEKPEQVINTLSLLDKRTTINTLARKAESSSMHQVVAQKLNQPLASILDSDLTAIVSPQANLIEIRAQSTNAALAADICNTVANQLLSTAPSRVLQIEVIDPATPASSPQGPQSWRVVVLGAISGLVLGIIFALLEHALRTMRTGTLQPAERPHGAGD